MTDVFDKITRSSIMQKVRSKGNKSTELRLIALFRENDIKGWQRNYPVKGHPDFVFLNQKIAIFVDGCFWHGHDCRNTRPKENAKYWREKRRRNIQRDESVTNIFERRRVDCSSYLGVRAEKEKSTDYSRQTSRNLETEITMYSKTPAKIPAFLISSLAILLSLKVFYLSFLVAFTS